MNMKKHYLTLLIVFFAYLYSASQVLYTDNFDSFTNGAKVAQSIGTTWWSTWSNAPGGAEDAVFSNAQSVSPANSVYVAGTNDLIFKTNDKIAGRFELSWKMFVPSSHIGYYNLLHNFAGASSDWGFQAYMYNDSIYVDAGAPAAAGAVFTRNIWHSIKMVVDLDDDFATFYLDGVEVISYKWSSGTDGSGTLNKLDAINFYAWDGTGAPTTVTNGNTLGYYIDDILFEQVTAPESPTNLTAVVNGADIDVNWTAPTTTPDNYKLSRNNVIVFNTPSALTYTDVAPWPNNYDYFVRAGYANNGYSHSSNLASATITGGVSRNLVLVEDNTSIYCTYCPYAAMGIRDLIETNSKNAVAIAYHPDASWGSFADGYTCPDAVARLNYYQVSGFPTVEIDGVREFVGVYGSVSQYPYYLPVYNDRIALPGFHTITLNVVETGVDSYTANITVEQNFEAWTSGIKLHTALTESNIAQSWLGQTEVDDVCRGMYPSSNGTDLDFSGSNIQNVILNFSTTGFVKNNCEFVAFIQHNNSKEVTQVAKIDMASVLGIEELKGEKVSIYPNPASDYMMLMSSGNGTLSISDITGKTVYNTTINNSTQVIDISKLSKGIYFVKVSYAEKSFVQKLVVE